MRNDQNQRESNRQAGFAKNGKYQRKSTSFASRKGGRIETKKVVLDRPLPGCDSSLWGNPWVQIKYFRFAPTIFANMIASASSDARAGDFVEVRDPEGEIFGWGFWNARARVPLRIVSFAKQKPEVDELLHARIVQAVTLRKQLVCSEELGNAFRVINSDGDGLSGLVVDCYDRTLSIEVHSLAIWQRLPQILEWLHALLGTSRHRICVDEKIAQIEGISAQDYSSNHPEKLKITEWGIRYELDFVRGHKTGFFCDQRDNRKQFADWISRLKPGARVLDLCCYSGGFSLAAAKWGGASEVIGVDLDEEAIAMAYRNANMNDLGKICRFVHADAFTWARQMIENKEQFDVVLVDPPKLITARSKQVEGERKYQDINMLAAKLARPGALFVSCSCSGLLDGNTFREVVTRGIHRSTRSLQILAETGAGLDHPVSSRAQDGRYLKVLWGRIEE